MDTERPRVVDHHATEQARGTDAKSWPVETILSQGYGVATIYAGDIAPDQKDDYQEGIFPLFNKPNETRHAPDEWGAIGAWAWGLSRALDYLQTDHDVDSHPVIVIGHSRMGKAAYGPELIRSALPRSFRTNRAKEALR